MADSSFEQDAVPNDPRPQQSRNETQTTEQSHTVQEREALERAIERDTHVPTEDWQFTHMLMKIAEEMTDNDLDKLKFIFSGDGGLGARLLEKLKTPLDLFTILKRRSWLSRDNLLRLQGPLSLIGRVDLIRVAADYAQKIGNVLHFYPADEAENGYTCVKFHIYGHNYKDATRDDIQAIRMKFAELLFCPPEQIVIAGVEPATSLILTFHIPESYLVMFKDLLKTKTFKAQLKALCIDIVEIEGEERLISCSDEDAITKCTTEQQKKLQNVYQLLQEKTKLLDTAEIQLLEMTKRVEDLEKERFKSQALLKSLETQFVQNEEDVPSPKRDLLKNFETLLKRPELADYDKALILSLLDANTRMVAKSVAENNKLEEQRLNLEIMKLRKNVEPLQFELLKLGAFTDTNQTDKLFLESFKRLQQSMMVQQQVTVQINEDVINILKKLSRHLRSNEREKLVKMYEWEPREDIKQLMDNDSSFCLVAILHKEIRKTQALIEPEPFVLQCLEKVNRKDLEKKFKTWWDALIKARETASKRKQSRSRSLDRDENAAPQVNETQLQKIADQVQEIRDIVVPLYESKKSSPYFNMYSSGSPLDKAFNSSHYDL